FTEYAPGTPSWVDLGTPDLEGAKAFYGALFGWQAEDQGPDTGGYCMWKLRGRNVGGLMPLMGEGQPPAWSTYVNVDDADGAAKLAKDNGGMVFVEPMDVMDAGRMAVFADPAGAVIGVWQPGRHIGADLANEPGAFCWNELNTRDPEKVTPFYETVFGWNANPLDMEGMRYTEWRVGDRSVGGMMDIRGRVPDEVPNHWLVYFAVDDCEAAVATATANGGSVFVPPTDLPGSGGRFSVLADPHGAAFAVFRMPA
ncbi:MAG: VOC family protein, partial [Actinobacteria bacterium]|nr:VOC family protein [Actinomycetota bacterium]